MKSTKKDQENTLDMKGDQTICARDFMVEMLWLKGAASRVGFSILVEGVSTSWDDIAYVWQHSFKQVWTRGF